jgi:hypothetical protein
VLTSRSGLARHLGHKNRSLRNALQHLKSLPDLDLRVRACDASSPESMQILLNELDLPIAGCVLTSAIQADSLFLNQTEINFQLPFVPKIDAFRAIESTVSIPCLDFFISITSIAVFGVAGQTNYSRYVPQPLFETRISLPVVQTPHWGSSLQLIRTPSHLLFPLSLIP